MRLSRTRGNRASMGKVVDVTAQGYEQRASAPAAAQCRTLTRRFAPPSPASRRGAGNGRAPPNPQSTASRSGARRGGAKRVSTRYTRWRREQLKKAEKPDTRKAQ